MWWRSQAANLAKVDWRAVASWWQMALIIPYEVLGSSDAFHFCSGMADGTAMPVTVEVLRCVIIPISGSKLGQLGGADDTAKFEPPARGSCPD